jgi:hypothetical protein
LDPPKVLKKPKFIHNNQPLYSNEKPVRMMYVEIGKIISAKAEIRKSNQCGGIL